ncbi:MAG: helix-turn-helix transcriptional regulator [Clostridia bacterium]|nr:helix-turn-helix transcriptional regulator [Clostridia bacterium]
MIMGLVERVKIRIKELIEQKGITIYALAEKADLTEACIRNWYTKRNYTPSLEAIDKICCALNISVAMLMCEEEEEMLPITPTEKRLLENWVKLEEKQKKVILMQMDAFLND